MSPCPRCGGLVVHAKDCETETVKALKQQAAEAYALGVADERARVVAWLRDSPKAETEARHYVDSLGAAHLALAIERGEHESEGT